jgi:hypothetical protein
MRNLVRGSLLALLALSLAQGDAWAKAKGPRFYFELRGVQIPAGEKAELKEQAKASILAELRKHPEVVLELSKEELEKQLRSRKLDGFGIVLRVVRSQHTLKPPPPGKVYRVLTLDVAVAIDAEKLPSGQLAMAGEGSAEVSTEVKKLNEKERLQLRGEALAEAIKQAVERSLQKLQAPAPKAVRRKKKR